MINRLVIKREARLEAHRRPTVRVVASSVAEMVAADEYCVPGGAFVYPGHSWARIDSDGQVWTGLDDFARKVLKGVERVELPAVGTKVKRGDPLFTVRKGAETVTFRAPVSGEVTQVNERLKNEPGLLVQSPYDRGWACLVNPSAIGTELEGLRIGQPVVGWYQDEVLRMHKELADLGTPDWKWSELETRFFGPGLAVNTPVGETVAAR
jgi:glycine cleavage system H lipoate-binding protein